MNLCKGCGQPLAHWNHEIYYCQRNPSCRLAYGRAWEKLHRKPRRKRSSECSTKQSPKTTES